MQPQLPTSAKRWETNQGAADTGVEVGSGLPASSSSGAKPAGLDLDRVETSGERE
jgi:hypothetical protein